MRASAGEAINPVEPDPEWLIASPAPAPSEPRPVIERSVEEIMRDEARWWSAMYEIDPLPLYRDFALEVVRRHEARR